MINSIYVALKEAADLAFVAAEQGEIEVQVYEAIEETVADFALKHVDELWPSKGLTDLMY